MDRISMRPRSICCVDAKTCTLRAVLVSLGVAGWATAALMTVQISTLVQEKRDLSIDLVNSRIATASLARQIDDLMAAGRTDEARAAKLED